MQKETSDILIRRIFKISFYLEFIAPILIYFFTKKAFYSILFLLGSVISQVGFLLMIHMIDKCLKKKKGFLLFFITGLGKMVVISLAFFLISRVSKTAVLFYMGGISLIVAAIMAEAVSQFFRSFRNGRT